MNDQHDAEMDFQRDENPKLGVIGGDNSEREQDASGCISVIVEDMMRQFAGLPEESCYEIIDFLTERGLVGRRSSITTSLPQWIYKFQKIMRYVKSHPHPNAIYAALHIFDEPILDDINANLSPTKFADEMGLTKAAVNKAVKDAQKFFQQPPRKDQRSKEACRNMSASRIKKLK